MILKIRSLPHNFKVTDITLKILIYEFGKPRPYGSLPPAPVVSNTSSKYSGNICRLSPATFARWIWKLSPFPVAAPAAAPPPPHSST